MIIQRRQFSLSLAAAGAALLGFPAAKSQAFSSNHVAVRGPQPLDERTELTGD
ncbi:MAG: hypothetical protein ACO3A7_13360 [Burkholderiaceae bacterium]